MEITVSSRNVEVTEALKAAAIDKIHRLERFLEGIDRARVHFWHESTREVVRREVCEVTVEGRGQHVRCQASAADGFMAVDRAVAKVEHQLQRVKSKLVGRRQSGRKRGASARLSLRFAEVVAVDVPGLDMPADEEADVSDIDSGRAEGPRIVRVRRPAAKPMTPHEAVLQMDLLGSNFYFFTNSETDRAALVYRRNGGDVGLMDDGD